MSKVTGKVKGFLQGLLFVSCMAAVGYVEACDGCSFDYDFEVQVTADIFSMCIAKDIGYEDYSKEECHEEFSASMAVINETQGLINSSTPVDQLLVVN